MHKHKRGAGSREDAMKLGNWDVRPLGGAWGCLAMVVVSIVASLVFTVVLNLAFRR